ncbi:DUF5683 domain-containing protein [Candidatus Marinimicrobia bacterium]|jgi:hypothetical protein|nr:DUF5683 domain-containing protein [Candidatus Neomarinimicrobiota bacterium]MDA7685787.1 DUF5683 domain-containing protein [Candidatus Neomarinimicrobiota bacterium]MDA9841563.1 DUF5683 domain-containing protein [Candidatus Neomarinimicrobiota bacterium]MDB3883384.1 DUF5683 domain-containing protein [Candidatus Neomarinimicrobiota bacterium]MDB3980226.1 DUF5683 domain-containing protein [Candidatus Neomarinimicrobiota bacterium]|tara:strand:+ start:27455 stop:27889 length:435 start_codon:yes stop_codon:yes gene_type:complete
MLRLIKISIFSVIIFSSLFSQQKVDFRTEEEQLKDPKIALKRSLTIPGAGQLYNDQKVKGYALMASEVLALWSFNDNRKKYNNYEDSDSNSKEHYLRERNRFAWIAIGLYFYGVLDAVVEAHLDNFDEVVKESDPLNNKGKDNE